MSEGRGGATHACFPVVHSCPYPPASAPGAACTCTHVHAMENAAPNLLFAPKSVLAERRSALLPCPCRTHRGRGAGGQRCGLPDQNHERASHLFSMHGVSSRRHDCHGCVPNARATEITLGPWWCSPERACQTPDSRPALSILLNPTSSRSRMLAHILQAVHSPALRRPPHMSHM